MSQREHGERFGDRAHERWLAIPLALIRYPMINMPEHNRQNFDSRSLNKHQIGTNLC